MRWEWLSPDKSIYLKTNDIKINPDNKKHNVNTSAHRIGIRGEKAERLTGEWRVNVYLDNYLLESRPFVLVTGIGDVDTYKKDLKKQLKEIKQNGLFS